MITGTVPHTDYPDCTWLIFFKHLGASANIAILQDKPDFAYLFDLRSTNRRKGEASALVREIDEYCITHGITVIVVPDIYECGPDGIQTNKELSAWYQKNGARLSDEQENEHVLLLLGKTL